MPKLKAKRPADYIVPFVINNLQGRLLYLPAIKRQHKREILVVYGQRSKLEYLWDIAVDLNRYGSVTMPDLPGFGGMHSFYKLGLEPTIENLADYLAAFIKWRYRRRRLTIVGLSFGFAVVTRMLQRYPQLARKVDLVISLGGFAHHDDFRMSRSRQLVYRWGSAWLSRRLPATVFRAICLRPVVLRQVYKRSYGLIQTRNKSKTQILQDLMAQAIELWQRNDVRTFMKATNESLKLDNCTRPVNVPLWHVSIRRDRRFDKRVLEQHLRVIFDDFHHAASRYPNRMNLSAGIHSSTAPLLPSQIYNLLASTPSQ